MSADPQFWNKLAERYAAKPVDDPEAFERKIAITKSLMKPDHVIADIGCGTGSLALRLAPHAAHVHGLDLSDEMLRIANGKAEGVDNVTFHCTAFDDSIPLEPGSLDGVCAYSILHLLDDRQASLKLLFDLLKPGGFFVSSTVSLGNTWIPYRPLLAVMKAFGKAPDVYIVNSAQLAEEAAAAGFVDWTEHDVGAEGIITFATARKPAD